MEKESNRLFAIYKNGEHKGNERGSTPNEAIRKYVVSSLLKDFLQNKEFMSQYSVRLAVKRIHFN